MVLYDYRLKTKRKKILTVDKIDQLKFPVSDAITVEI